MPRTLRERATSLGMKAVGKLFEDPKRAEAIASAIGGLQRAKKAIDEAQRKALHAAGLVTREDFKAAGKRLSHLDFCTFRKPFCLSRISSKTTTPRCAAKLR